ncbi:hypothetical protein CBER1_11633 [Cercospora berteroae]|uniref:N-acetyltransferase domain-containing protein n=1 Tax=Cercospora berteroae TaxID=357750 RepID=A0A2S6CLK2_9PEZI|nr:hypothetical protein CBER1_11633 [Cercospora berteroae]
MSRRWRSSSTTLSDLDSRLSCDQLRTTGRILKGQGHFSEASRCFEGCLSVPGLPNSKRTLVICHLSDVYCELEYIRQTTGSTLEPQAEYLNQGREMIELEINRQKENEIEIRQNHFDKAKALLDDILILYDTLAEPDVDDKVGHVRALISRARISSFPEAEGYWTTALLQNEIYNPGEEEVFTCGVIYLFIAFIRVKCGDWSGSQGMLKKAIEVIRARRPQFLIPGLGTYLFDYRELMDLMNGLPKTTASSATPRRKTVNFLTENSVKYIEGFSGPIMSKQVFETFNRNEITDSMLVEAVSLFNDNYGVWGTHPIGSYPTPKQGSRVKLSKDRLRAQYLPENVDCSYVKVTIQGRLAGNVFACRWKFENKIVCWITQLVVHGDYRERGLAVSLLNCVRRDDDNIYGLMS